MILNFDLSKENQQLLALAPNERICYAVPYDITADGQFLTNSYAVVTDKRLILLEEGKLKKQYRLSDCEKIASEPQIDCGLLIVTTQGKEEIAARFSAKHLARFSYVARGCTLLLEGSTKLVSSEEYEKTCPKCHRALPGTRECPHCTKKSGGFVHEFLSMLAPYKKQMVSQNMYGLKKSYRITNILLIITKEGLEYGRLDKII